MWTMRSGRALKVVLTAAAMLTLGGAAHAQTDDHGVRIITQDAANLGNVTAGDTPGLPVTISESGSYRLGSNLILPDGDTTGIEITAQLVTVDLHGFSIIGPDAPGNGAGIRSQGIGTTVVNGAVLDVGSIGVDLLGPGCRVEGVRSLRNWGGGISTVRSCTIVNNGVGGTRSIGIRAGAGNTVIGNTVRGNTGLGMALAADAGYAQNVVTDNNGGSANLQVSGGIQMGLNVCGTKPCR